MAEVEISYKGSNIATMNASGTKTLLTEAKYLEDDVTITYARPSAPSGTKQISITQNGQTTEDVTNYASAQITANVPNTYSAGDEGKVVDDGALVAQTSRSIDTNGTYDTTTNDEVVVNVSGGGGKTFELNEVNGWSSAWNTLPLPNNLASGGTFEVTFYCPTPHTDYDNIIGIATSTSNLSTWSTTGAINFYFGTTGGNYVTVRQSSVTTNCGLMDSSVPHTLKVDKDYIYFDGVAIVATSSVIVSSSTLFIGATQGTKRYIALYKNVSFG